MKKQGKIRAFIDENRVYIIFLAALLIVSIASLFVTRRIMLVNARKMGEEFCESYLLEEEKNFNTYKNLIRMGAEFIEIKKNKGAGPKEIESELQDFFDIALEIAGEGTIDPYAVIDGEEIAANPWGEENIRKYQKKGWYKDTEWYQKAVEANGEVIFTDAYVDSIYKKNVITIAKEFGGEGNVIAFDIFPENFHIYNSTNQLPERGSYYLCDSKGTLLYKESVLKASDEAIGKFAKGLFDKIQSGENQSAEDYIYDLNGKRRAVYSYETSSGWVGIFTMPYSVLLDEYYKLVIWYGTVFVVFLSAAVLLSIRSYILKRDIRRTNDTIRILGNSYYGIYRVDYDKGGYERIKGTDYSRNRLDSRGSYEVLLDIITEQMEPKTKSEFLKSFSLDSVKKLVKEEGLFEFGGDYRRSVDGEYGWVNVKLLFDPSLGPQEMVLCFRDVDEEKNQQLQHMQLLEDALSSAKESEESQRQFFANMSHDMRTPLNAIIGMSDMALRPGVNGEKIRDYLAKIHHSSKQLLNLINDILEMSRLEQGRISLENNQFNMEKVLENIILPFQIQAEKEGKRFDFSCDIRNTVVLGDENRLAQIMNNLLSNAVKFTKEKDSIFVEVYQIKEKKNWIYQIIVKDTGIGMSEDFLPRLFIPYERELQFGEMKVAGTGLGMSIIKNIIVRMGGEITVDSVLGGGTTFILTLPFQSIEAEELTECEEKKPYTLEKKQLLLVEDYELNMEIATDILEMEGAVVTQAWNGEEALSTFESSEPFFFDAILMDMQMPKMDGCEAAKAIRKLKRPDSRQIPILAVTANAFAEDIARTKKAGMDAHISKPIDADILCRTLGELIDKREQEKR